jgi:hypothetical protein
MLRVQSLPLCRHGLNAGEQISNYPRRIAVEIARIGCNRAETLLCSLVDPEFGGRVKCVDSNARHRTIRRMYRCPGKVSSVLWLKHLNLRDERD